MYFQTFVAMDDDESSNSIPSISSNRNRSSTSNDQPTSSVCPLQKRKSIATTESVHDNPTGKRRPLGHGGDTLQHPSQPADDFKIFATFVATELRKIKDPAYAQATQRQMLKLLLERMENEPATSCDHCSCLKCTGH